MYLFVLSFEAFDVTSIFSIQVLFLNYFLNFKPQYSLLFEKEITLPGILRLYFFVYMVRLLEYIHFVVEVCKQDGELLLQIQVFVFSEDGE